MADRRVVKIVRAAIYDRRTVEVTVNDGSAVVTTPTGRAPMRVIGVDLSYNLADGALVQMAVRGYRENDRAAITRRFDVWRKPLPDHTPNWLRTLVEDYRPRAAELVQVS